jgi:hypothetical protein
LTPQNCQRKREAGRVSEQRMTNQAVLLSERKRVFRSDSGFVNLSIFLPENTIFPHKNSYFHKKDVT